jgi:hypothetical protein
MRRLYFGAGTNSVIAQFNKIQGCFICLHLQTTYGGVNLLMPHRYRRESCSSAVGRVDALFSVETHVLQIKLVFLNIVQTTCRDAHIQDNFLILTFFKNYFYK